MRQREAGADADSSARALAAPPTDEAEAIAYRQLQSEHSREPVLTRQTVRDLRIEEGTYEDLLNDLRTEITDDESAYDAETSGAVDLAQWAEVDEANRLERIAVQSFKTLRTRAETPAVHFDDGLERRIDPDQENKAVTYAQYRRCRCVDASLSER